MLKASTFNNEQNSGNIAHKSAMVLLGDDGDFGCTGQFIWLSVATADTQIFEPILIAEIGGFSAWRPYNNPTRLVNVGMNKGEVFAIAGKVDREESYYSATRGRLIQISDWYYVRTGFNAETTLLKFTQDTLVSIISTPIP